MATDTKSPTHTPGPWRVIEEKGGARVVSDCGYPAAPEWPSKVVEVAGCRCAINGGGKKFGPAELKPEEQAQADARLIAAAPDALKLAREVAQFFKAYPHLNQRCAELANDFLAKALGTTR